ncbi:LPS-assembly protein LptD [Plastorhodobacter daqingensis]|uniref:LPS-assembly protein LptD n=1 Tax=Plastorhodobacter daqingensis TaxID=1387281 RepID=A0ABW2UPT8_9RHOB
MIALRTLCAAAALSIALAVPGQAQDLPATLVADRVQIAGDNRLIAEGAVEVLYGTTRMRASRIIYDRAGDRLTIEGPITLVDAAGVILVADEAELSTDLREGLLQGARMVLEQQLQLAATSLARREGRYTELRNTVASSCQICANNPTPLWEIRAARVLHDQEAQQLYFDRAQFRIMGLPVAYIPRLRMPDPTLDRANGFLAPRFRTTSTLGYGVRIPYFFTLGDHADVTVSPYISSGRTRTLDFRYRQALPGGSYELAGAISDDDLEPSGLRGYVFGSGRFDLRDDYVLSFGLQAASDSFYLQDYDISDQDRLTNRVELSRTRRDEHFSARVFHFRSIRAGEVNALQPTAVTDLNYIRRETLWGGIGTARFNAHTHYRPSDIDMLGRDVGRASGQLDWQRSWILRGGLKATANLRGTFDQYAIRQDSSLPPRPNRFTPAAAVELRWPWARQGTTGVVHVIEPVVQVVRSHSSRNGLPDEDSVLVEFDEGNLFSLNRFPGWDRHETGTRVNAGLQYSRLDPAGWQLGLALGRVLRDDGRDQFPTQSGLGGARSDWLVVADITNFALRGTGTISLTNRALFADDLSFSQNELRLNYDAGRLDLASSYLWAAADPAQGREADASEWVLDAAWRVTANWQARTDWRYDFEAEQATRAGFGLIYRNECVAVDLSLSRRFTSSTSVRPTTTFGLSVDLVGFGTGQAGARSRSCSG